ncbi:MAG: hypothetical protein ACO1RT_13870 [Planctomycetaceae bacterium]
MNVNRLIWNSWSCMSLAIRMLTLVAFTAHAVLGCCLSHGSCMRGHAVTLAEHGCEHDHAIHGQESPGCHDHVIHEVASEVVLCTSGSLLPDDGHDHPRHCDDVKCVFGVSACSFNVPDWLFATSTTWSDSSVDFWPTPCLGTGFAIHSPGGPPRALLDRAVLQVWRI